MFWRRLFGCPCSAYFGCGQAELQKRVTDLEGQIRAERNAQRDLKLVLAAAERQAQADCTEKREIAAKCAPYPLVQ
jgi:hypothetical protein